VWDSGHGHGSDRRIIADGRDGPGALDPGGAPGPRPRGLAGVLVGLLVGIAGVVLLFYGRIPQDPTYHGFADHRALLGVPNALNVLSNAPFALVGLLGLGALRGRPGPGAAGAFVDPRERWFYGVFFVGVGLTALGSAYYHLAPDNPRLVWDRLPMTLAFMSLVAAVVGERVGIGLGLRLLAPLTGLGLLSVLHWHLTEQHGAGDLRLYALVQFVPLVVVPLLLALYPPRYTRGGDILRVVALYLVAKVLEAADAAVFGLGGLVSGHSLKHLVAALATYQVLVMVTRRTPREP
jgi:hypothetical protein